MEPRNRRIVGVLFALGLLLIGLSIAFGLAIPPRQPILPTGTPTPRLTEADVQAVAVVLTYEAQVFPEPYRSLAYTAIAWTMRNRIEIGFAGTVGYTDERLLSRYSSYQDHKDDPPDPLALEIARKVLIASTNADDPTRGARHYVDNSYWTGTHDQTGPAVKVRGKFSDGDLQRLVGDDRFQLAIEWKTSSDYVRGPLFYGLYFFDTWPPPLPIVTPTFTPTRQPTATAMRTATRTNTPTATPRQSVTLTMTPSGIITTTATLTFVPATPTVPTAAPNSP